MAKTPKTKSARKPKVDRTRHDHYLQVLSTIIRTNRGLTGEQTRTLAEISDRLKD